MPAEMPTEPTHGYKSTEFATTVVAAITLATGAVPPQYAGLVAAVVGVYVAARTLLKVFHSMGYVKQIPDLPMIPPLPAGSTTTTITQVPKT